MIFLLKYRASDNVLEIEIGPSFLRYSLILNGSLVIKPERVFRVFELIYFGPIYLDKLCETDWKNYKTFYDIIYKLFFWLHL